MSKVDKSTINLFSTVRIDGGEIMKRFVTVLYPPESFAGFGIPKVILSDKELSEQEIDQNLEEMARQNVRWMVKQAKGTSTMLIEEKFADINGRKYRRYSVRKIGNTFSPYDKYRAAFLLPDADLIVMSREQAWHYLRTH